MMKFNNTLSILFACAALLWTAPSASATAAPSPQEPVSAAYAEIQKIAAETTDAQVMVEAMDEVLGRLVNYDAFARRTLKGTWRTLSSRQRKRFKKAFKALILKTYARRFKPGASFEVTWRAEPRFLDDSQQFAEVRSTVTGQKAAADVDYIMAFEKKAWAAHDIIVDEVSMAMNWRKQFKGIIDKSGFKSLVERIEKKVKK
jgi:ABC-type transporter MlaC component